jgi:hypothetical protein
MKPDVNITKGERIKYTKRNPLWDDFKVGTVFEVYYPPITLIQTDPPPETAEVVVGIVPAEGATHLYYITLKDFTTYFEEFFA